MRVILLAVFGIAGTLSRYWMQDLVQKRAGSGFPWGTLAVNIAGCFVLGLVGEYALNHISIPPDWRVGITTGFFGAFTTFSTFAWETGHLIQDGDWTRAASYVLASLVIGVAAMLGGMQLGNAIS